MNGAPVLVTERLELWRPVAADLPELHAMMQDDVTRRFFGAWEATLADMHARLLRNVGSWSLYGYGTFMVRERGQATIIGNCGVFHSWRGLGEDFDDQPEAGWIVAADKAGQGYAGEAMAAVFAWFDAEHGPRRTVCISTRPTPPRSGWRNGSATCRCATRSLGATRSGCLRDTLDTERAARLCRSARPTQFSRRAGQSFPVSSGTTLNRSPTRPMSATWKIGASSSLLMAMMVLESFIPARCWIAPEMPTAM